MRKLTLFAAVGIALTLAGCSSLSHVINTIGAASDLSVPPQAVIIAANGFDAIEVTGKNVLVACTPKSRPAACNDAALRSMVKAIRAGRNARNGLEGFLASHPGALGPKGLFDVLTGATATITTVVAAFNTGG